MAEKVKSIDLGVVVKIHPSGIGETNKGHKAFNVVVGDQLVKNGKKIEIIKKSAKADAEEKQGE